MSNRKTTLMLLLLVVSMFSAEFFFLRNPSNYDEGNFLLVGRLMTEGYVLYEQHAENKPPLIFLIPYVVHLTSGLTDLQTLFLLRILSMVLASSVMIALFLMCRDYFTDEVGLLASLLYGGSFLVLKYGALFHVSSLVMAFEAWAVYFFLSFMKRGGCKQILFSGLLTGLAVSAKQTGLLLIPLLAFFLWYLRRNAVAVGRTTAFFVIGLLLTTLPFAVYVYGTCQLDNFLKYAFIYNVDERSRDVYYPYGTLESKAGIIFRTGVESSLPLILLGVPGILYSLVRRNSSKTLFLSWLLLYLFFQFVIVDHVWDHYFLELVPALSIISSVFFLENKFVEKIRRLLDFFVSRNFDFKALTKALLTSIIVATIVFSLFGQSMLAFFSYKPSAMSQEIPSGSSRTRVDNIEKELFIADYIRRNSGGDGALMVVGEESYYLWTGMKWPFCLNKTTNLFPDTWAYLYRYAKKSEVGEFVGTADKGRLKYIIFTRNHYPLEIGMRNETKALSGYINDEFELDPLSLKFEDVLLFRRK
ncbi:MAG: glycosyltransferase family 39 protein [Candidatus Altiarchaeota archaeon]|nr:glycosyltransferase family 39 protein [Candidatus Altiarchaeota archaeon]